jgi:hypothetical protein
VRVDVADRLEHVVVEQHRAPGRAIRGVPGALDEELVDVDRQRARGIAGLPVGLHRLAAVGQRIVVIAAGGGRLEDQVTAAERDGREGNESESITLH